MHSTSFIKYSTLLTITIFILSSCSRDDDRIYYDLTGSWKVIYFMDGNKKITKTEENTWLDINNGDIIANFTKPDS